ncbi:MAG: hypothetical protein AAF958_00210 [Planctomycetota bacterium]
MTADSIGSGASLRLELATAALEDPAVAQRMGELAAAVGDGVVSPMYRDGHRRVDAACQRDVADAAMALADDPRMWPWLPFLSRKVDAPPRLRELQWVSRGFGRIPLGLVAAMVSTAASVAACALILVFIVPQFDAMFTEFELDLPALTLFIIRLSRLVQGYGVWGLALLVVVVPLLFFLFRRGGPVRRGPGKVQTHLSAGQWAESMADWLECGAHHALAARLAVEAVDVESQRQRLLAALQWGQRMAEQPRSGVDANTAVPLSTRTMPSSLVHALGGTLAGPPLIQRLRTLAQSYRLRAASVESAFIVTWLPLIMIFLVGGMVMLLVVALVLPLLSLVTGLTG